MAWSAWRRTALAVAVSALLWLAVAWAITGTVGPLQP
jgi:hypothetical protein